MKFLLLILSLFILNTTYSKEYQIFDSKRESVWTPLTYVINGTFDVIQNPYWFSGGKYSEKSDVVWNRIKSPSKSIKADGGYKKFFKDEFLGTRVAPNIALHLVGGSYDTLMFREYFDYYGYSAPGVWAFFVTYAAHFGNEAIESSHQEITSHDHIADLFVFDVAAFMISYNKTFMNFLLDDLQLKAWHFQPVWSVKSDEFFNVGLNYITRPKLLEFYDRKLRPFIYFGMQNIAGLSYVYKGSKTVSLGAGMSLTDPLKQKGRFVVSLFHETNDELDASLFINGSEDMSWRLNLYPNLLKYKNISPGFIVGNKRGGGISLGLSVNMPFGLGVDRL